jgi:exodeoxyribonuclease VII small subunit
MAKKADAGDGEEKFDDIAALSFEQSLEELEEIVRRLESGEIDLDGAIQAYARGAALKKHCDAKLRQAEQRVSRINIADDGTVSADPVDLDN